MRHSCSPSNSRFDSKARLTSTATNTNEITPDASLHAIGQERTKMIGVIIGSVLVAGLVLSGVFFFLRRRVNRSRRVADTTRATSIVPSYSASFQMMERQGDGVIVQHQNLRLDHSSGAAKHDTTLTVAAIEKQSGHPGRCSQISATSSTSRSIRFAVSGSHHSSSNSNSSRATVSVVIPEDGAHTPTTDPFANPISHWTPVSLNINTTTDHSASWRGANLSNIINAARGIKA